MRCHVTGCLATLSFKNGCHTWSRQTLLYLDEILAINVFIFMYDRKSRFMHQLCVNIIKIISFIRIFAHVINI